MNVEAIHDLTPLQLGMYVQSTAQTEKSNLYHTQVVIRINGSLDLTKLEKAWCETIQRTDALRSAILPRKDKPPLQCILREVVSTFQSQEAQHLENDLNTYLENDRSIGFDYRKPSLSRIQVFHTPTLNNIVVWSFAHIILDGWSSQFILSDWLHIYIGLPITPASKGFRTYQKNLDAFDKSDAISFWTSLKTSKAKTDLPMANKQEAYFQSSQQRELAYRFSSTLIDNINSSSRNTGITPATLFLAAWALTCCRLTQNEEYIVGWGINGRQYPIPEIYQMVGMLIQTVPIPINCESSLSVSDWLEEIQRQHTDASQHAHISLSKIASIIGTEVGEPVFTSLLVFENAEIAKSTDQSFSIESIDYIDRSELPLVISIRGDLQFELRILYRDDYYDDGKVKAIAHYFENSISTICANTSAPVWQLSILSETERQELIFSHSHSATKYAPYSTAVQWINQTFVDKYDQVAIEVGRDKTSYATLRILSETITQNLLSLKCGNIVAICLAPGTNMIATIIGILSANAAYVVISKDLPSHVKTQYIESLLQDQSNIYLVKDIDDKVLDKHEKVTEVYIDDLLSTAILDNKLVVREKIRENDIAYIIFTSGSTGIPKAIPVTHRNLVESTASRIRHYSESPMRFLLLSPFHFDSVVAGLYWSLSIGGTLIIPVGSLARQLDQLPKLIKSSKPTHTLCLPSVWDYVLDNTDENTLTVFEQVILAGETLPPELAKKHHIKANSVRLFNEYGPTEGTVWCTYHEVKDNLCEKDAIPIGKPIDIAAAYIVDSNNRLVPKGVPGELLIGGRGITLGYLNGIQPERFTDDLFRKNERTYRTGDRVHWGKDDNLYILGRVDNQLKLRGIRFEAESIEHILEDLSYIDRAVVFIRTIKSSAPTKHLEGKLIAVISAREKGIDTKKIRNDISSRLNNQLIPQDVIVVPMLPQLSNGKIDRQATIALGENKYDSKPEESLQALLVDPIVSEIHKHWEKHTQSAPLSISENFFEVGGDSLSAARFIAELNESLNSKLSIADLYQDGTFSSVLKSVRTSRESEHWSRLIAFNPAGIHHPLFFLYGNGQILANALGENFPIHWMIHGTAGTVVPYASIENLAREHVEQIIALAPSGPIRLVGFSIGGVVAIEIARQLLQKKLSLRPIILIDPTNPLNFIVRSRRKRLATCLRSSENILYKTNYIRRLVMHSPKLISERILRNSRKPKTQDNIELTADVLTEMHQHQQLDRQTIIKMVESVLTEYKYTVINHPIELIRSKTAERKINTNWLDEKIIWSEIANQSIKEFQISTTKRHDQLFRDADAVKQLSKTLKVILGADT